MNKDKLEHSLKTHHNEAYRWSCQCCKYDVVEGEEVLQIAYLKILEGKAKYNEKSTFKTWLFSVIRFTAIDYYKGRKSFLDIDHLEVQEEKEEYNEQMDYKMLIMNLPEQQQKVLLLYFYHEMTLKEISQVVDLHIGTVRTHYERGKSALRSRILDMKV